MYKIIGADGRQYGPVNAEQLRQWIAQGRANAHTQTLAEGATEWKLLGAIPEFAAHFAPQIPPAIAPSGPWRKTNNLATTGFIFGILSVALFCCCGGFPFNLLGLIFSIIALVQIFEHPQLYNGRALAIAGVILSIVSFLIFLVLLASNHAHVYLNSSNFR